ncbi:MAG TPA: hypothetical protein VLK82_08515 [Candidatus Tectomicrobia bacterium]|nr:hypothetical protein [Candidatus Tectomicrobia bacterium]
MDFRNQRVRFKIRDVYYPDPMKILLDLHGEDFLAGMVVDITDSGMHVDAFVVIEAEGIAEPIIVPVARIIETL